MSANTLESKVIVVTGAARGLGRAYAQDAAKLGASVVLADKAACDATAQAISDAGGTCMQVELDVAKTDSCEAMADAAIKQFGRIDGLINNAAMYGNLASARFDQLDEDEWQAAMNVNVTGVWRCCKAVSRSMISNESGSIVNISSLAAVYGLPNALHYSTSKAAVIGMTRSLARELGRKWVRVNAVAPSAVLTEGTEEFFGDKLDKAAQVIAAGQSLQRNLETGDVSGTVMFLLSDASKFVTGQTHMVDGGTVML